MTIRFLTNFALLETSVCSQNRPAGNTDPPRIRSNAYGSIRLVELMTNLWFLVAGEKSVPLKMAENSQKSPGITLEEYPKMPKFGTKLKRPILVSIDSS